MNATQVSKKASELYLRPNKLFSCAEAIVIAAADVKPETTGTDTKSTKKPDHIISGYKLLYSSGGNILTDRILNKVSQAVNIKFNYGILQVGIPTTYNILSNK